MYPSLKGEEFCGTNLSWKYALQNRTLSKGYITLYSSWLPRSFITYSELVKELREIVRVPREDIDSVHTTP